MQPRIPSFSESLTDYLKHTPGATQASWSNGLNATYAAWKARPFRWMDGSWRSEPEVRAPTETT